MSNRAPLYPLLVPIVHIQNHSNLPVGAEELHHQLDSSDGRDKLFTFVKQKKHLSILISYYGGPLDEYFCHQYDFPLKVLSWFPWALEEFRKPPAEGGLHAGALISKDMDVNGEMLAVGSTTKGYFLTNWSRNKQDSIVDYDPAEISLSWDFLYERGLLNKWKELGDKFEQGVL